MSELVEKNIPYEILIRLNQDGVQGAHYKTLHVVTYGERKIKEQENLPIPLALVDDEQGKTTLKAALGEALTQAIIERDQARQELAELKHQIALARERIEKRHAEREARGHELHRRGIDRHMPQG